MYQLSRLLRYALSAKVDQHQWYRNKALPKDHQFEQIPNPNIVTQLRRLRQFDVANSVILPEILHIAIEDVRNTHLVSLLHNRLHLNVTSMFNEGNLLVPEEDSASVVSSMVGSYL